MNRIEIAERAALVGAAAGTVYLTYDYIKTRNQPGAAGVSVITKAIDAVTPNSVIVSRAGVSQEHIIQRVPTFYPRFTPQGTVVDATSDDHSLVGVVKLGDEIFGVGAGEVIAVHASCETQTGELHSACFNCSMFNVHWTSNDTRPAFINGHEVITAFNFQVANQVTGFRDCIQHLKELLTRRYPGAVEAARSGDLDAYQVALGRGHYAPMYERSFSGNNITDRFMFHRYQRLVGYGYTLGVLDRTRYPATFGTAHPGS